MGNYPTKISIANAYEEAIYVKVSEEEIKNSTIHNEKNVKWYQQDGGYQRVGQNEFITVHLDLGWRDYGMYLSVGSERGLQFSHCLPIAAKTANYVIGEGGSVMPGDPENRFRDQDGNDHEYVGEVSFQNRNNQTVEITVTIVTNLNGYKAV